MGALAAIDTAGQTDLDTALRWHLQYHYPPVPSVMVEVCAEAVDWALAEQFDHLIELPAGVTFKGEDLVTVETVLDSFHLGPFLDMEVT